MFVTSIRIGMTVTSGTMPPKFYFGLVVEDQKGNSLSYVLNSSVATVTGSDRLSMYNTNDFLDGVVADNQEVYITLPTDLSFDSSRQGSKITKVTGMYVAFADEKAIHEQVREHLEMAKENMEENLMLCIDNMLAEIKESE